MAETQAKDEFEELFSSREVADKLRSVDAGAFDAAAEFWRAPRDNPHMTPRMRELILLAIHAAATSLNSHAISRQVRRAIVAGATQGDIVDALVTISTLANHALYTSVPILEEEWKAAGQAVDQASELLPDFDEMRQRFVEVRGFWNSDRDPIARQIPDYFKALTNLSVETWQNGSLTRKEREFLCIAVDCSVTHSYEPGLRLHIRNAIGLGATRDEILVIFQLAALMGLEGYALAGEELFGPKG